MCTRKATTTHAVSTVKMTVLTVYVDMASTTSSLISEMFVPNTPYHHHREPQTEAKVTDDSR